MQQSITMWPELTKRPGPTPGGIIVLPTGRATASSDRSFERRSRVRSGTLAGRDPADGRRGAGAPSHSSLGQRRTRQAIMA
jgi:hypothetical protein